MKLHFGVVDLPYADSTYKDMGVRKPKGAMDDSISTGDVAEILEHRYHVMEVFFEVHGEWVAEVLAESYQDALENAMMGAPVSLDPSAAATEKIQQRFREFLTNKEMDSLGIPGVPTMASLEGHSKRFKQPYKKRKPRPSFIDTGLYQAAMKVWTEE